MENEPTIEAEPLQQIVVQHDFNTKIPGYRNFTLALALPDPDSFLRAASDFVMGKKPAILMGVGIAKVHPDDKPSRKRGRELALKNMKSKPVKVVAVAAWGPAPRVNLTVSPVNGVDVYIDCTHGRLSVTEMLCAKNDDLETSRLLMEI